MQRVRANSAGLVTLGLLAGLAASICLRVLIGGAGVAQSPQAGLAFAVCLTALAFAAGTRTIINRQATVTGILGGLALCIPAVIAKMLIGSGFTTAQGFIPWALVVAIVAVAEEYFLRGALFEASQKQFGASFAVFITATAFAALHVPLYGWHVLPLDLAVGFWLGALRLSAGTWTAPAIAHTLADLIAWWLR